MKIIICASISAADEIESVQHCLEKHGHNVQTPLGIKRKDLRNRLSISVEERAADKIRYDLIKQYYKKITENDCVLIVNAQKGDMKGCIGGNTFLEMGFAYILNKPLYLLYSPSQALPYISEIMAMQPIVLHGDIMKLFDFMGKK